MQPDFHRDHRREGHPLPGFAPTRRPLTATYGAKQEEDSHNADPHYADPLEGAGDMAVDGVGLEAGTLSGMLSLLTPSLPAFNLRRFLV